MSFFTGFAEGFATSVDRRLRDDLERTYDKVSKLSALRAKTIVEGSTKHANEFNNKNINDTHEFLNFLSTSVNPNVAYNFSSTYTSPLTNNKNTFN